MNLNDYEDTPQFGSKPEVLSDVNLVDRLHDIPGKILHNVPCIFYSAQRGPKMVALGSIFTTW